MRYSRHQEVKLLLSREELCNRRLNFGRLWSTTFWKYWAVDHLARGSMKNAANCASECELQDIWASTLWTHIAGCGLSTAHVWLRVGLSSIQLNCWHWASPSRLVERVASSLTVRACVRSADSRVVCSAWVGVKLLRGSCSSIENLNYFKALLFHDLRAGKVTRQI